MLGACSSENEFVEEKVTKGSEVQKTEVPFGFSVGHMGANTRMTEADTQADQQFRGIEFLHMIPFDVRRNDYAPVGLSDTRVATALNYGDIDGDGGSASTGGGYISDGSGTNGFLNGDWTFPQTQSRLYKYIDVPNGTSSFLVYGRRKHPNDYDSKIYQYGALQHEGIESAELSNAASIKFTPQRTTITAGDIFPTKAMDIITYLNNILNSTYTYTSLTGVRTNFLGNTVTDTNNDQNGNLKWDGTGQKTSTWTTNWNNYTSYLYLPNSLSTAYNKLIQTFDGVACTSDLVLSLMNSFVKTFPVNTANNAYNNTDNNATNNEYTDNNHDAYARYNYQIYNNLVTEIRSNIQKQMNITGTGNSTTVSYKTNSTISGFPVSDNLPDGICYIRYDETSKSFSLVTGDDLNVMVPPAHYTSVVFPPELWYYANSTIKTTEYLEVDDAYMKNLFSTSTDWDAVLADRHFTQNKVRKGMTGLLVEKPLNYAVGRLDITVKGGATPMQDGAGNNFDMPNDNTNEKFPLTGVLVTKQHPVGYNFQPNSTERFMVYDRVVDDDIYIRYNTAMGTSHTLVLPSNDASKDEDVEKVTFILEFQNNSGVEMRGAPIREGEAHCRIPAGAKFYLIGEIDPSTVAEGDRPLKEDGTRSRAVFMSDHITKVNVTVKNFKDAYNIVPDLTDAMMTVSLNIQMNWEQATPKSFLFE